MKTERTLIFNIFLILIIIMHNNQTNAQHFKELQQKISINDSIIQIIEDEYTGEVYRIFIKYNYSVLTTHSFVKNIPTIISGIIFNNGYKLELEQSETVNDIRNGYLLTSNHNVLELKTVFKLYQISTFQDKHSITLMATKTSNGDYSYSKFMTNDRFIITEAHEGGIETLIQIYNLDFSLLSEIKPYDNLNASSSSYAISHNILYYSVEPDEYDINDLQYPKILMINLDNGLILKENIYKFLEHCLNLQVFGDFIIGYDYKLMICFDLNLSIVWERNDLISSNFASITKDHRLFVSSKNELVIIDIRNGKTLLRDSLSALFGNNTDFSDTTTLKDFKVYKLLVLS